MTNQVAESNFLNRVRAFPMLSRSVRWSRIAVSVFLVALLALYVYGAVMEGSHVNFGENDQDAYGRYTVQLYKDASYIDGNRMPLFPYIVRLFYQPGMTDNALLWLGIRIGIVVSVLCLAVIGFIFFRYFPALLATTLTLITAFSLFMVRAAYYQPELLFATLLFIAFVLMLRGLYHLTPLLAASIGLVLGLAMLTKGSALLALVVFVVVKMSQTVIDLAHSNEGRRWRTALRSLTTLSLSVIVFLVVMSGYVASSRRIFGTFYYNVNTTFYVWYDSWTEAKHGTKAHNDRTGWPNMPPNELPSMSKYLLEHDLHQIIDRVSFGIQSIYTGNCGTGDAVANMHCKFIGLFGIASVVAIITDWRRWKDRLRKNAFLILFCALLLFLYLMAAAWWMVISDGPRFTLMLVLPLYFMFGYILSHPIVGSRTLWLFRREVSVVTAFLVLVLVVAAVDTFITLTTRVFIAYGGH